MKISFKIVFFCLALLYCQTINAMQLLEKLEASHKGDYIITAVDNTYTALVIREKTNHLLSFEEITAPLERIKNNQESWKGWKAWIESGAPGNTAWSLYTIDIASGNMLQYYSFTNQTYYKPSSVNHFLSQLLNLQLTRIPKKDQKRIGPPPPQSSKDTRSAWSPQMVYEGKIIPNVSFEAWRTEWPKDSSELSQKIITIYVPKEEGKYPSYFPYWLEIQGMVGKAKVRIIDSGRGLHSPKHLKTEPN